MAKTELKHPQMLAIARGIHNGYCIPFLGAGVNVVSDDAKGLPVGSQLAEKINSKLGLLSNDPKNLSLVTLQTQLTLGRWDVINSLKEFLPDLEIEPSPLLETLAALPFNTFITANYDRLLELALQRKDKTFEIVIQISQGFDKGIASLKQSFNKLQTYEGILVYKIHGTLLDGAIPNSNKFNNINEKSIEFLKNVLPEKLKNRYCTNIPDAQKCSPVIVTEEDYIEFLSTFSAVSETVKNKTAIPEFIIKRIQGKKIWLFLGYSLKDWDVRAIYRAFIEKIPEYEGRMSYAIMKESSDEWEKLWSKKDIEIINLDLSVFADQLKKTYWEEYKNCTCDNCRKYRPV